MQQINQGLRGRVKEGCGVSDVERLEETQEHLVAVKNLVDKYENCYDKDIALKYCRDLMRYHTRWLIQQAERVEEQQKEIECLNKAVEKEMHTGYSLEGQIHDVQEKLEKENARLRKALGFYADASIYNFETETDLEKEETRIINTGHIFKDYGAKAREALKE